MKPHADACTASVMLSRDGLACTGCGVGEPQVCGVARLLASRRPRFGARETQRFHLVSGLASVIYSSGPLFVGEGGSYESCLCMDDTSGAAGAMRRVMFL